MPRTVMFDVNATLVHLSALDREPTVRAKDLVEGWRRSLPRMEEGKRLEFG